jgi:2,3-bisphosphoglycerate-independent phosphoglycerate mutase
MIRRAQSRRRAEARVHVLLDGRDVPETSALDYVDRFEPCSPRTRTADAT